MDSFKVRKTFLQFFKSRGHELMPGSSVLGAGDPSLLFVNAGMNQFKNVFLGLSQPPAKNVVSIQKCLRAGGKHNDLEMVGETPLHHTFFEMLGNFSFGGYFKDKAIALAWEFLTQELALDKKHLWITVHKEDQESYQIWKNQEKIPENKIYRLGDKDNFWRMGDTGPCGPCSEIHYYTGTEQHPDPSHFMEIWNLVFMEFNQLREGEKKQLARPCVDTGMGLERICAVLQNKTSNYQTDLFKPLILELEKASGLTYNFKDNTAKEESFKNNLAQQNPEKALLENINLKGTLTEEVEKQKAFRVLADHSRSVALLIHEGLLPGSSGAEYVLRRIMRRAFYYGWKLNKQTASHSHKEPAETTYPDKVSHPDKRESGNPKTPTQNINLLSIGVKKVIEILSNLPSDLSFSAENLGYSPDLKNDERDIQTHIKNEAGQFLDIIKEGEKVWEKFKTSKKEKTLTAKDLWNLYSTYGLPIELSQLKFKELGWQTATDEEIKQHREEVEKDLSRGLYDVQKQEIKRCAFDSLNSKNFISKEKPIFNEVSLNKNQEKTEWTAYNKTTEEAQILGLAFTSQNRHSNTCGNPTEASLVEIIPKSPIYSFNNSIKNKDKGFVIMDKTCFYPEGGGPIGDKGWLFSSQTKQAIAKVLDCQKQGDTILHEVEFTNSARRLKSGDKIFMEVNKDFREGIKSAHTATHLLNSALREILDPQSQQLNEKNNSPERQTDLLDKKTSSVRQAGSLVEPYRLRFDFTHPRPLTKSEILKIEDKLRQNILAKEDLKIEIKDFNQAEKEGALFLKGEKAYGKNVRVISIGDKSSKELCGGIHVENTQEIEAFKIVSESGVQSGVRRITAYTGLLAKALEEFLIQENLSLREQIHLPKFKDLFLTKETSPKKTQTKAESQKSISLTGARATFIDEAKAELQKDISLTDKKNPFLIWLDNQKEELKTLRKKIVRLEDQPLATLEAQNSKPESEDKTEQTKAHNKSEYTKPLKNLITKTSDSFNKAHQGFKDSSHPLFHPWFHFLAQQMLELREYLKIPLPKEKNTQVFWNTQIQSQIQSQIPNQISQQNKEDKNQEPINLLNYFEDYLLKDQDTKSSDKKSQDFSLLKHSNLYPENTNTQNSNPVKNQDSLNPVLKFFKEREKEKQTLKSQWKKTQSLNLKDLLSSAKDFEFQELKGKLLVLKIPLEDRKILSDLSDFILSALAPGVLILLGEGKTKAPVLVNITKDLTKAISANDILKKTISPLCKGQGGGRPHFAQGSVTEPSFFSKVEATLLEKWK